jgi:hypothetical protein
MFNFHIPRAQQCQQLAVSCRLVLAHLGNCRWAAVPEVSEQGCNKLAVQLLTVTRADRTAGRVSRPPRFKWHWGVNNVQKTNELWLANKGEILKLPPQEQASMMQTFVSIGTNIVAQNPVVKAEMEKLQALVDVKRPK